MNDENRGPDDDDIRIINPEVCEDGKIKVKSKALIKKIQSSNTEKKYLSI